jgi:hypothetical protein
MPNPINETPEIIVIPIRLLTFKSLRKLVVRAATKISQHVNPRKIILLYIKRDSDPVFWAVLTKTEPYIPNQKRIDKGQVIDIMKPVRKHFNKESFSLCNSV